LVLASEKGILFWQKLKMWEKSDDKTFVGIEQ
jgi:hypothetical protein